MNGPQAQHEFMSILDVLLQAEVEHVCRVTDESFLVACFYEHPESSPGSCDGWPCSAKATVHDLVTDRPYCSKHFKAVTR